MKYKESFYNIEIDRTDNFVLLFNSLRCVYVKLNEEYYGRLKSISLTDIDLENDVITKDLYKYGLIIEDDVDEMDILKLNGEISKYNNLGMGYTIAVTMDCNMACPYCYERHDKTNMTIDVADKIVDNVKNNIKDKKFLDICWYGGEPLLALDIVEYMSEKLIKICEDNDVPYYSFIVTNGLKLNRETAELLKNKCKVSGAQVTIDGLEETHNKRRISLDKNINSFNTIVNNIDSIKDFFKVSIRVNVDKDNSNEIDKLLDYFLYEMNWKDEKNVNTYIARVEDKNRCSLASCYSVLDFNKIEQNFVDKLFELNRKSIKNFYPRSMAIACGAQQLYGAVIDPHGNYYKCWEEVGIDKYKVGSVGKTSRINKNFLKYIYMDIPDECRECKYLSLCNGGCPRTRLYNGNKSCCYRNLGIMKDILKKYYIVWSEEKREGSLPEVK
ncbi:radical SAM/SPASM domain-containing protein [Sporanaerobacter sp. PP17-6a]|uniref:radical SAM/SPASM domain-containing protein n=1 Tax=Sporanaerobacter sp. PP17-6a TaxID=1891289 RepID=UPI0008A01974|nr:radical SAM protein [Sporanaerobacter sp. PP17-6a]SCL91866.1 hypothetical protein PP176A_2203 [Sporanaerobacter sp. PP17-6a]